MSNQIGNYTAWKSRIPPTEPLTSFRIIYVPGMKPKPEPQIHKRVLLRCLIAGLDRVRPAAASLLDNASERFELFSWTYDFHGSHRDIGLDLPGIESLLAHPEPDDADRREIDSTVRRLRRLSHLVGDLLPVLGRWIATDELRVALREARRYLQNRDDVANAVRGQLIAKIQRAWDAGEQVLLFAHSLGSVIAYDCLWELTHTLRDLRKVDLFITIGSPLRTRFIRRHLRGADSSGPDRYPHGIRRWHNFSARSEMTALHPRLRPFFGRMQRLGLMEEFVDGVDIYNHFRGDTGLNVHKSYGYLLSRPVAESVADWLVAQESAIRSVARS